MSHSNYCSPAVLPTLPKIVSSGLKMDQRLKKGLAETNSSHLYASENVSANQ